jgi:hypothetical protein
MTRRIADFCADHITAHGPVTLAALAEAARSADITRARYPESAVLTGIRDDKRLVARPDGRWDTSVRLLDGAVLTHRIRFQTRDRQEVYAGRELGPLQLAFDSGGLPLATGGVVEVSRSGMPAWRGPDGWLPVVEAGSLLAFQLTSGKLSVQPVSIDADAGAERAEFLRTTLARHARWLDTGHYSSVGVPLTRALLSALVEVPDLLAEPVPPLDEVLRLPPAPWADAWTREIVASAQDGDTLVVPGVPHGLAVELRERARLNGISVGEYVVVQLAAIAWRAQPPCRHEVEERRWREDEFGYARGFTEDEDDDADVIPFSAWDQGAHP